MTGSARTRKTATALAVIGAAGRTVSYAFTTRLPSIEPGVVGISATAMVGGQPLTAAQDAAFAAASCN